MRLSHASLLSFVCAFMVSLIVVAAAWAGEVDVATTSGLGALNAMPAPNTSLEVDGTSTNVDVKDEGTGGCTGGDFCFGPGSVTVFYISAALPAVNQIKFYLESTLTLGGPDPAVKEASALGDWHNRVRVPEPAGLVLYGSGLALVGFMIRRQRLIRNLRS